MLVQYVRNKSPFPFPFFRFFGGGCYGYFLSKNLQVILFFLAAGRGRGLVEIGIYPYEPGGHLKLHSIPLFRIWRDLI